ncbi:hypothetical protein KC19_1G153600 [Ceratodon purpureus]|uniref:Peptidase A1 domain-containing protein n=1 Tax=Ceratodon purpureus TaxID=3225 RepID=A0A8T0J6B5_CERPU|nr:hypothetical protein KC19_1G153600 [Ceratodon purpureus]
MGFLKVVLLMLMSSSYSIAWVAPWAPDDIHAYGRRDDAVDDAGEHALSHRRHSKNDAPGIRFDMTRRASNCSGPSMLQGADSRLRHVACAFERSARRLRLLAGKRTKAQHLRGVTHDTAHVSGKANSDWKFPEFVGAGDFMVSIVLGTPPVKASIIIDTASDLTWIQSQPCNSCHQQKDPMYDPSKSSTYNVLACSSPICDKLVQDKQCTSGQSCRYAYRYIDGSETDGYLSTETMTVSLTTGEISKVALFPFGASDATMGTYTVEEDGIFGLGQGPISLPSQLGGNKFSYCLVDWQSDETSSLYFGDAAVPKGKVRYTPIVPNAKYPTFWYIRMIGISVGSKRLPIAKSAFEIDSSGQGGTIVDTASTLTVFLPEIFDQIAAAYKSQVKYPVTTSSVTQLQLCFDTAGVSSPTFPTLEIHLDGANLSLPTQNVFVTLEENITCLAVMPNFESDFQTSVIGNIAQQNYDIVYDSKNMKMGFSPTNCASV